MPATHPTAKETHMKTDIPIKPAKGADFPDYIAWVLSSILVPYPLYVITTVDEQGIPNAQPNTWGLPFGDGYGQFFLFTDWASHHTAQNVIATKEFVVNIPSEDELVQAMKTVERYPRGVDEIAASGLTAIPSMVVKAPRVAECKAHLECRLCWHRETHARPGGDAGLIICGEIVAASGDEDVLTGTSSERVAAMKTVYVLSRSADAARMEITDPMTCGTIDRLKDFVHLSHTGTVKYMRSASSASPE
jgi:flavin reductase (DIM6/NTAB) family NADH-FMN oxidoreductase RutF